MIQENWKEWSRDEQMLVYVLSLLTDLSERGVVSGGEFRVSKECRGIHNQMEAAGIKPTQKEIEEIMGVLQSRIFPH